MANQLKMAEQHAIVRLAEHGWSYRRIAREMGVHRETVARYVALSQRESRCGPAPPAGVGDAAISITGSSGSATGDPQAKPAISITGSDDSIPRGACSKPAISIAGSAGRRSGCEPFRAIILEGLEHGLTAQRIWQDLRTEHGFTESYQSVQRFVRYLRAAHPLPFRRMECEPGAEAQIDFGAGVCATRGGRTRRSWPSTPPPPGMQARRVPDMAAFVDLGHERFFEYSPESGRI